VAERVQFMGRGKQPAGAPVAAPAEAAPFGGSDDAGHGDDEVPF